MLAHRIHSHTRTHTSTCAGRLVRYTRSYAWKVGKCVSHIAYGARYTHTAETNANAIVERTNENYLLCAKDIIYALDGWLYGFSCDQLTCASACERDAECVCVRDRRSLCRAVPHSEWPFPIPIFFRNNNGIHRTKHMHSSAYENSTFYLLKEENKLG